MTWLDLLSERGLAPIATALGLDVTLGGSLTPCPSCGAESRGDRDRRGPIGTGDGIGWRCWRCGLHGGPADLLAAALFGTTLGAGDRRWGDLRHEAEHLGLLADLPLEQPRQRPAAPPVMLGRTALPPESEVRHVWAHQCVLATADAAVSGWLRSRGIDPATAEERELVRALRPSGEPVPEWATRRGWTWDTAPQRWRVVLPMFDGDGGLRSLHARALHPTEDHDKATLPRGFSSRGLVMANRLGQLLLQGHRGAIEMVQRSEATCRLASGPIGVGVVIVEGIPDFLTAATHWTARPFPAVLGIVSGSWAGTVPQRIPDGTTVLVATDPDAAGDEYAKRVADTLAKRCRLVRWRASGDVNGSGLEAGSAEPMTTIRRAS